MFSSPVWDVGNLTGIIGAITGPAGCVIGWISYRRSQQIKRLDLRLELRKQVLGVRANFEGLPTLLEKARASRSAVRAAMGRGQQSGDNLIWERDFEKDRKSLGAVAEKLPDAMETYRRSRPQELEDKLVEVHALAAKVGYLRDKYESALASDDKDRDYIRSDAGHKWGL